jgi:hypothetical protein
MKSVQEIEKEITAREAAEKAAQEKEWQRITAEQRKWKEAQEHERKQAEEVAELERRVKAEQELEDEARNRFFAANSGALEEDYKKVRDQLRQQILLDRAGEVAEREKAARRRQATLTKSTF